MLLVIKTVLLFFLILFILPVIFFALVGGIGKFFYLTIDKNCWLAKTKIRWIKSFLNKN